ncbi:MAG: type II toxin-antitoxin system VapC family toxin [Proteobacteria bacterium]|nr:type II toxin-antitoxin system VapC family toxin [Pseudomonadota bacterium]
MNRLLIDTNIYSHALRGTPDVVEVLRNVNDIAISAISIGELLSGFKGGIREKQNRKELAQFLDAPRVRVLSIDDETAEFYASALNSLKKSGRPIPTNDLWIGAVALQHGLALYSKDQHFKSIPGLICVD